MTAADRGALSALQRRLSHMVAIATLIAQADDSHVGEACRGLATMASDCDDLLEKIMDAAVAT